MQHFVLMRPIVLKDLSLVAQTNAYGNESGGHCLREIDLWLLQWVGPFTLILTILM